MSHSARGPFKGIDDKANAFGDRRANRSNFEAVSEGASE